MIKRIAYFLHLIDEDDRLNLEDIAFCVILCKVAFSAQVDWSALVTLAVCCLNLMHRRHTDNVNGLQDSIAQQAQSIKDIADKVAGVLK